MSAAEALQGFRDMGLSPTDGNDTPIASQVNGAAPSTTVDPTKPPPAPLARAKSQAQVDTFIDSQGRAAKLAAITDPSERDRLAHMSNSAFNRYYGISLKLQNGDLVEKAKVDELLAAKDAEFEKVKGEATSSRFFDHEEGYRLTEEYKGLESAVQNLNRERNHWQKQLSLIRKGKPYKILEADKDGNVKESSGEFDPADDEAEGYVISKISQATALMDARQQAMARIPVKHKETFSKMTGFVGQLDKKLFEKAVSPQFVGLTKAGLEQFPATLRNRPEIQLIAKMQAAGTILLNRVAELEAAGKKNGNSVKALASSAPAPLETAPPPDDDTTSTRASVDTLNKMVAAAGVASY